MVTNDKLDSHRVKLEQLRDKYLEKLPTRLDRMEYLVKTIPVDGDYREDGGTLRSALSTLYQEAHKIAGAAGSVGLLATSQAAKQILDAVDGWFDASAGDPLSKRDDILSLVTAMRDVEVKGDPVPILFLTSDTHPDQKVISAALGGDDYITKPFDADYLLTTVFARARRSRRLRTLLKQNQPG